jgi:hypothetical protein
MHDRMWRHSRETHVALERRFDDDLHSRSAAYPTSFCSPRQAPICALTGAYSYLGPTQKRGRGFRVFLFSLKMERAATAVRPRITGWGNLPKPLLRLVLWCGSDLAAAVSYLRCCRSWHAIGLAGDDFFQSVYLAKYSAATAGTPDMQGAACDAVLCFRPGFVAQS